MKRDVELRSENPREMIRAGLDTPGAGTGPWPTLIMGAAGGGLLRQWPVGPREPGHIVNG